MGLAAVWATNALWSHFNGNSDYQTSVNKRVTDAIYDKHVYELDGWDFLVLPLALKGVRAGARFLAPDMMESAVSNDNKAVEDAVFKEDKDNSEQIEEMMRQTLPIFLHAENAEDRDALLKALRSPISLSLPEEIKARILFKKEEDGGGPEALQKTFNMTENEVDAFARKAIAARIQDGAKFLVYCDQPLNDWARQLFNADGTLKEGQEVYEKLRDRWPAPAGVKHADNTITNENLEIAQSLAHYG